MDTELFMECEEEELEPWQQVDDSVEEDDMEYTDNYGEPVEDSSPCETPPPRSPLPSTPVPAGAPPFVSSPPLPPLSISTSKPAASAPPLRAQAPPLILTQTTGGTFLLPAGAGATQPILLTAQGFQVPTVMTPGAPLVLNLQPNLQTVQLIQSPPLGQLVRPAVTVSTMLSHNQTGPGPAHPGSGFTTLTIRTGAPGSVNLQVAPVGGAGSLKLAGSTGLRPASTNGILKATPLSAATAPGSTQRVVTTATAAAPPRVVMSVEEFYYGRFSGDVSLRRPPPPGAAIFSFTCNICCFRAENNLRLMQHVLHHSELVVESRERQCCRFCYRQFSSQSQLRDHQDQVHGSAQSTCLCRICEWAFDSEPAFLNHMKSNHKPGEMPYVCQVCSFRSSFYSDVVQHFATFHRETPFLLCVFCLKVMKNPGNYQQHLFRHKLSQAFHCNRCRLQFTFLKDKMQHKVENHRSFRRPPQLEGLPPGSKVTIRTYGKVRPPIASTCIYQPNRIKTEPMFPIQKNPPLFKVPKSPTRRGPGRREPGRFWSADRLVCLECGTDASDLTAHFPTYVHCLLCPYSSCCSRAYAAHMIHHHVRGSMDRVLPLQKTPPPCAFLLRCSECDFLPQTADQMAEHLLSNPEHNGATCCSREYVEPDILLCLSAEQRSAEEPDQNQVSAEPAWKLAESWKRPEESSRTAILSFTQPSGPNHFLSKNSDAIDFFSLLFPPALVELIAKETNAHAKACRLLGCCPPDWVPVTGREVKGFLGLVILMGVHNLPDPAHYWSFNHFDNSYTFHRAMPLRRFQQIAAHLRMGSFVGELHGPGRSTDPLHAFRPMLGLLGSAMWDAYRPNCCLAVDRALLPSLEDEERSVGERGGGEPGGGEPGGGEPGAGERSGGEPGAGERSGGERSGGEEQRGGGEEERGGGEEERGGEEEERGSGGSAQPQVWLLCDSKSGYCHRLSIQLGRRRGLDLGFSVVPELVRDLDNKHHQLFLANSLASIPLMQMLLKQNIYACSSFPPPSPILPRPLWDDGELHNPGDFLQRQCGPLLVTRWRDTKEMGCLSTNAAPGQPDAVWRSKAGGLVTIERPMAFRLLQENMRGVDICKQLLACNPLGGVPQDRHWRNLFWFLVNLSVVNAFIVLRESRKDNPPAWVQDGLFSQLAFRRRLGNQLARCAQRHGEGPESPGPRGARAAAEEPVQQRHKMAKISSISKRCRNCNMKNLRHESVYGCTVCDANLCKRPSCFWEFHGLPPLQRGSTKLGFLKDRLSGEIVVDEVSVDETFGPVEDLDFSDDEPLDEPEDEEEMNPIGAGPESSPPTESGGHDAMQPAVVRPGPLSVRQLRIILFALCEGLRQASRVFSTDPQLIRRWLREARARPAQEEEQHADGAARMVAWVLSMREQQLPLTESNLFNKASVLKKKKAFGDAFRISYDWAVGFLLRHRLGVCRAGRAVGLGRAAPPPLQAQVCAFREFTRRAVRSHRLAQGAVAAMDELCIFVDFRLVQDSSRRREALELSGSTPLLTVYLAVLADGTLLPALVLLSRPVPQVAPPDLALLEVRTDSLSAEDALDLWTTKVWLPHLSGPACSGKSLLVLDRHREHLADPFLAALSAARSLPAVIPSGCSFRLQPLDVCLKPALQRFLLARWARFAAGPEPELDDPTHKPQDNVTRMLVDWLLDAMMHLRRLPHTWRTSFQLTGLLQDQTGSEPRDQQTELIRTLTGILLGPDAAETEPAELQEEEDQDGDREETSEEKPMSKVDETEDRKETEDSAHETRGGQEDMETLEDSEEEEGQQRQEETKEASRERREMRIEIGEEVGDEWKIRGDGARTEEDS